MNEKQAYLLKLLKEIDGICRNNSIQYYLAAGTMLGAIRHRGFIPWDDDADIIMTKKNYDKFIHYFETHDIKNRVFQYRGNNPHYPMIIGRYYDKETTGVQRGTGWDIVPAGQYIDVMILIPLPKEEKLKKKTIERIILYVELNNDMYTDNGNRGNAYTKKYKRFLKLRALVGKKRLLRWFEKKIFCFSEDECDEFMISHAIGSTLTFKKDFFGKPIYVPFEDTKLPVAENYLDLFWYGYGSHWRMLPPKLEQETHVVIDDFKRAYPIYVNDYMQFLNKEEVLEDVKRFKIMSVFETNRRRVFSSQIHQMDAIRVKLELEQKIKDGQVDLENLISERKFDEINSLFSDYQKLQFKKAFTYWGLYVDLEDDLLYYPLYRWVVYTGEYYRARKVLTLRENKRGKLSPKLEELKLLINLITEMYHAHDYQNESSLKKLVLSGHSQYPEQIDFYIFYLKYIANLAETEKNFKILLSEALTALKLFPESGECMRFLADAYKGMGDLLKAKEFYSLAEIFSRNGETLLYIKDVKEELKW